MIESCAQIEHKAATDHRQFQHFGDNIQMENRPLLKLSTCQMHQVNRPHTAAAFEVRLT
jgi:hypothetical protein